MTNKKLQEIIDYLECGEKFTDLLVSELNRTDLSCYEKRTYSSLLDALNGATELYCAKTEWPDNVAILIKTTENKISDNDSIVIKHGSETIKNVHVIVDYLNGLTIDKTSADRLVELMTNMLNVSEHETYIQGFADCMKSVQNGGFKGLEDKILKVVGLERKG